MPFSREQVADAAERKVRYELEPEAQEHGKSSPHPDWVPQQPSRSEDRGYQIVRADRFRQAPV